MMKRYLILLAVVLCPAILSAQEETAHEPETLISGKIESGGYGGVFVSVGPVYHSTGVFVGGRGGWIINHRLVIGGMGYGLVNDLPIEKASYLRLDFGCGGGMIEYIIASDKLVHMSAHTMIGAGGVSYSYRNWKDNYDPTEFIGDAFFVVEPGIEGVLNISKLVRAGLGVNYRVISGVNYGGLENKDLSGVNGHFVLMFGKY